MFSGALILESVRVGSRLNDLNLVVREIYRFRREDATADQPETWSVLEFEVSDDDAPQVAEAFRKRPQSTWVVCRFPVSGRGVRCTPRPRLPLWKSRCSQPG
jgi:hypothetical protein